MANHITALRKKAGFIKIEDAVKALKISRSMLYQMEEGYKRPSAKLGVHMSKVFKCTTDEIFLPFNSTDSDIGRRYYDSSGSS